MSDRGPKTLARLMWGAVALVLLAGLFSGVYRGVRERPDWGDLANESRYVWEHQQTRPGTAMFGYLPTTTFVLWPFTAWLPQPAGVIAFVLVNLAAGLLSLWLVYRHWLGRVLTPAEFALPAVLIAGNLAHAISANQMTLLTLVLCVGGLALVGRKRGLSGGLLIGLAALIKTLPALLGVYLLLTRRWRALLGMAAAAILFDLLPSLAVFGFRGTIAEHRAWVVRSEWHSNRRLIEEPFLRVHRHSSNTSYAAALTRWLRRPPDATRQVILYGQPPPEVVADYRSKLAPGELLTLDPMPPDERLWSVRHVPDLGWVPRFHLLDLSAATVWWLWAATLVAGFIGLCWATWRTAGNGSHHWAPLAALWMLAMFFPSPMMRHYYLAWALPAVAVVACTVLSSKFKVQSADGGLPGTAAGWARGRRLAVAALALWLVGVLCLGWFLPRWYGIHLAALLALAAATVGVCRRALDAARSA